MIMTYSKIIIVSLAAGLAVVQAQAAITSGDSIFVDFGKTFSTGNENNITSSVVSSLSIASAKRFSDGAFTGVGIATTMSPDNGWTEANTIAGTGPNALNTTDSSVYGDALGRNNGNQLMSITFTGLDDALTYDLTGGISSSEATGKFKTNWTIAGQAVPTSQISDATIAGGYISFTGLTSSAGTLTITLDRSDTAHMGVSQLQLTAIPEPGTYALLGGLLALGYVMVRRRR
jgi:hypothetical protein